MRRLGYCFSTLEALDLLHSNTWRRYTHSECDDARLAVSNGPGIGCLPVVIVRDVGALSQRYNADDIIRPPPWRYKVWLLGSLVDLFVSLEGLNGTTRRRRTGRRT